jgi:intermediate cleaving peptidase 55
MLVQANDINKVEKILPDILKGADKVYTDLPRSFQHHSAFSRYVSGSLLRPIGGFAKTLKEAGFQSSVEPLRPLLNKLRVRKSDGEIANMRKAGQASGRAYTSAMGQSYEREKYLGAFLDSLFKLNGCEGQAYVPVIAGGKVGIF